jgi:hypothetical protein
MISKIGIGIFVHAVHSQEMDFLKEWNGFQVILNPEYSSWINISLIEFVQ